MLIVEHSATGKRIVRFYKDWNANRIGCAYTPTQPIHNLIQSADALLLQRALLKPWAPTSRRRRNV